MKPGKNPPNQEILCIFDEDDESTRETSKKTNMPKVASAKPIIATPKASNKKRRRVCPFYWIDPLGRVPAKIAKKRTHKAEKNEKKSKAKNAVKRNYYIVKKTKKQGDLLSPPIGGDVNDHFGKLTTISEEDIIRSFNKSSKQLKKMLKDFRDSEVALDTMSDPYCVHPFKHFQDNNVPHAADHDHINVVTLLTPQQIKMMVDILYKNLVNDEGNVIISALLSIRCTKLNRFSFVLTISFVSTQTYSSSWWFPNRY